MRIYSLFVGLSLSVAATAQNTVNVDKQAVPLSNRVFYTTGGHPVSSAKYVSLSSGSPYFSENWMSGTILTTDSAIYSGLSLKMDLLDNTIIYLNNEGQEMVSVAPIHEVSLRDTMTSNGKTYLFKSAAAIPGGTGFKGWYQVVSAGKLTLYKLYNKEMLESKAYMSSITEQNIRTDERYFVGYGGKLVRVKKIKDINDVVGGSFAKIIDGNKFSDKKEADWIKAVELFNAQ
jgi:hypothetical protein